MPTRSSSRKVASAAKRVKHQDKKPATAAPASRAIRSTRVKKTSAPREPSPDEGDEDSDEFQDEEEQVDESSEEPDQGRTTWSIARPVARTAGKTPYTPDRIHPNTFIFLADLKANNNREWLKRYDDDFRNAQKDFESFVDELSLLVMEKDPTVPELPKKDLIFRIYRDVRFSPDPTPYKPHFSVAWSRTGKKGPYAAYYVQIKPGGESFVGGGLWNPDGPALATIREDIDQRPHQLKSVLMSNEVRRVFFDKAKGGEKGVVAAFIAGNSENALKTKPKGFAADHSEIDLLRLRNFTMGKKFPDTDVLSRDGINRIADAIGGLVPWVTYLNSVVMPDT